MKTKLLFTIAIISMLILVGCKEETIIEPVQKEEIVLNISDTLEPEEPENETIEVTGPVCGDNICNGKETKCSCAEDCGDCEGVAGQCLEFSCINNVCLSVKKEGCCGNGICDKGESASTCSEDCPDYDLSDFPKPFTSNTKVIVGSEGAATDPSAALKMINAIGSSEAAYLDYEITSLNNVNSIIIGTPCQNTWAKQFYGEMSECTDFIKEGRAIAKLFKTGNKYSILIAGKTARDTLDMADMIAKNKLSGNEYILK